MQNRPSLAGRVVWALVLMIGFYVFAAAILAGLVYLPYAEIKYANRLDLRVVIFCGIGAFAIFRAILPRVDKFTPPGPRLLPEKHRRLFKELENVAARVNQPLPEEVYLVPDMNAWVAHRGGVMGYGSRPVMGLGLPLMQVLTVSELRAVLAHEFGHYQGGDTKLAPWVYKTRSAIVRTLENLEGRFLSYPFLWYGKMFLRITNAISRRQEYEADALAAEVAGAPALSQGLKTIYGSAEAFSSYWEQEVSPVLAAGFRPPLAEGFMTFMKGPAVSSWIAQQLDEAMGEAKADPYDTHPPLKERLAALDKLSSSRVTPDDRPAFGLLDEPEALEEQLVALLGKPPAKAGFKPIRWAETCEAVYLPGWTSQAERFGDMLADIQLGKLPAFAAKPEALIERFEMHFDNTVTPAQKSASVNYVIGSTLAAVLHKRGWALSGTLGQSVVAARGDVKVMPFTLIADLGKGKIPAADWEALCRKTGVLDADLGEVAPPPKEEAPAGGGCACSSEPEPEGEVGPVETIWVEAVEGKPWTCPRCGEINGALYDCCYKCEDKVQRRIAKRG
jgi:heat shock protein HtpX